MMMVSEKDAIVAPHGKCVCLIEISLRQFGCDSWSFKSFTLACGHILAAQLAGYLQTLDVERKSMCAD